MLDNIILLYGFVLADALEGLSVVDGKVLQLLIKHSRVGCLYLVTVRLLRERDLIDGDLVG